MTDAFEQFQARVRANARIFTEADLYWRTNRWAMDGYSQPRSDSFNLVRMADILIRLDTR
jgi:hypothetical protein